MVIQILEEMKNYCIIILLSILMIQSTGCEREARNVILPDFHQKLVINSYISPSDTASVVKVSSNMRIYGILDETEPLGNLSATISDGTSTINLTPATDGFIFRPEDMQVTQGKTYKLSVKSDPGLSAEAKCTVPSSHGLIIDVDTEKVLVDYWGESQRQIKARIYITDYSGEENFYRFSCKMVDFNPEYFFRIDILKVIGTESDFFTDKDNDGKRFYINSVSVYDPLLSDSAYLIIYIQNTDKAYYDYHRSLEKYSGGDDPFTEVSLVFSNVTGGLGIFAAYTIDSLKLKLK
jgi:hypothetical protein